MAAHYKESAIKPRDPTLSETTYFTADVLSASKVKGQQTQLKQVNSSLCFEAGIQNTEL